MPTPPVSSCASPSSPQLPVLTTLKAKGAFPENHPLSVGVRGALAEHFLNKSDVLFSIGSSLFPNRFSHAVPGAEKKTIVQCTVDTLDINRSYETRHAVIGDAKLTLQALIDELTAKGGAKKKAGLVDEIRRARRPSSPSSARGWSRTRRRSIPTACSAI
jgi:Thiamine pyrophosphate-requiring enzymes [acetolactate synthase, pyruvate dehydrogenase (cytochrome), glyoxylate carboligase, phosphonopyruvate decarboxylase]